MQGQKEYSQTELRYNPLPKSMLSLRSYSRLISKISSKRPTVRKTDAVTLVVREEEKVRQNFQAKKRVPCSASVSPISPAAEWFHIYRSRKIAQVGDWYETCLTKCQNGNGKRIRNQEGGVAPGGRRQRSVGGRRGRGRRSGKDWLAGRVPSACRRSHAANEAQVQRDPEHKASRAAGSNGGK